MMEDTKIIEMFWSRDEHAIRETEQKYGRLCMEVARNIVGNERDAEEITNEAYLSVWNNIPPERPTYFKAYLCKITKNLAVRRARHNKAGKRNEECSVSINELEDILTAGDTTTQQVEQKLLSEYISAYLRGIEKQQRDLFLGRYWYNYSIRDLARKCGMSESNVKTKLHRIRKGLKKYLEREGIAL